MTVDEIVRVISIRSDNPRGFGGCIFSARPIDPNGNVRDARKHVVVEVSHKVLAGAAVEVGQWWRVTGSSSQFKREVHGFQVTEVQIKAETLISLLPSGEHIVAFMSDHDAFVGIGPVKARRLWETYGERLYDVLDRGDVAALAAVLSKESAAQVAEAWTKCGDGRTLQNGFKQRNSMCRSAARSSSSSAAKRPRSWKKILTACSASARLGVKWTNSRRNIS